MYCFTVKTSRPMFEMDEIMSKKATGKIPNTHSRNLNKFLNYNSF